MPEPSPAPLVVGNCSGFYGDRLSAMRELLLGDPCPDVITGDYLAELTMLILGRDQLRDPDLGYARTFLRQAEDCLDLLAERGTRLVVNAGGLNPAGLAARVRELAHTRGLDLTVAHVEGDDVREHLAAERPDDEQPLTANAYLGAAPIAAALRGGADVVVTGRCTDAALVVGPAIWHHGWGPEQHDELAGATVAGHVLECGTQATGGNFSGFLDLPPETREGGPLGFPLAEVAADGSAVITQQAGTGGAVTVDTVTAQLLYEVQSNRYLTPDVTVCLDSVAVTTDTGSGPDRVRLSGTRGEPPPERLKVSLNTLGGHRNHVDLVLTGLDLDAKEAWVRAQLAPRLRAADVVWTRSARPNPDAEEQQGASRVLRCTVRDPEKAPVDRDFTAAVVELALGSYPGFAPLAPPAPATPYGVHRSAYVDRDVVAPAVVHDDGRREEVGAQVVRADADLTGSRGSGPGGPRASTSDQGPGGPRASTSGATRRVPLGTVVHARSGDKGGDANLGLWVRRDHPTYDAAVAWLLDWCTPAAVRALLPETAELDVEVHPLPNLGGVNVVLPGLLGEGVAASVRFDPQAKGLGEWARGRTVEIPEQIIEELL